MRSSRIGGWAGVSLLVSVGCSSERDDVVRRTIGTAGGLISSHDGVLTLVLQPGALDREVEIEVFPSDQPPLIFGPAYRVKPDIELAVDAEITYRRALPNNLDGVAVAAIRLDDYSEQMGRWRALPRLSIDEASGAALASDHQLSLYYGMLESGGGPTPGGTSGAVPSTPPTEPTNSTEPTDSTGPIDPTNPVDGSTTDNSTTDPTDSSTADPTDPTDASTTEPPGPACGDGSLDPGERCFAATDYAITGGPVDLTLGDFDADGNLDVATANADGTFSVRLGDGRGGFAAEQNEAIGMGPTALAASDFDAAMGDDLVIALGGANELRLLQAQGDGTFTINPVPLAGLGPVEVLLADVTDDGIDDVLVANADSNTISFFPFGGGLGFETQYTTNVVTTPVGMSFGQYNENSNLFEDVFAFGGGNFSALPGDGVGLADAPVGGSIGTDLRRAVGGDLGGGTPGDAAVVDFAEGGVYVMLGDGEAIGFTAQDFYATGPGAIDVAAGDVTGDGDLDLVVANRGNDTVTMLERTGGSSWGNAADFDVASEPSGVGVGDLNEDGIDDIVVSGQAGSAITVLVSDP